MERRKYDSEEEWLADREGRITGSRLSDVVVTQGITKELIGKALQDNGIMFDPKAKKEELEAVLPFEARLEMEMKLPKKMAFYELVAERMSLPRDQRESAMNRGHRLEVEAVNQLEEKLGFELDKTLEMWTHETDEHIAVSPDAFEKAEDDKPITFAAEVKCLSSAKHIKAYLTQEIPDEYWEQVLQYFILNPHLVRLYFCFYDPNLIAKQFFYIVVNREEVAEEVEQFFIRQQMVLEQVNDVVNELTF